MLLLELDRIEARADPGGSVWIAGEEDVLGQFAWTETDVVLPFSGRGRDPAIPRLSTRVSAFGKTDSLSPMAASLARNSGEDSPARERASSQSVRA
jgi:hypothetical protein